MADKIQTNPETPIYFANLGLPQDSGLIPNNFPVAAFSAQSLNAGSGWMSSAYDLGPGPRTTIFEWRASGRVNKNAAIGTGISIFVIPMDPVSNLVDGNLGSGNSLVAPFNCRRNLQSLGMLEQDGTVPGGDPDGYNTLLTSGLVQIYSRAFSVMYWNSTSYALAPSGQLLKFTPIPDEVE